MDINYNKTLLFLESYQWKKKAIERLERKIDEIEETVGVNGVQYSDMPKAHTNSIHRPTEEIALKLIDLKNQYEVKYDEALKKMQEVEALIISVDDPLLMSFLELRYIDGMTMEETAEELDMSDRHIYRLQKKALKAACEKLGLSDPVDAEFVQKWVKWKNAAIAQKVEKNVMVCQVHFML